MKKFFYSFLLLLGLSVVLSSCEKIGGGDDFDGVWDTQWETNDLFNRCDDWEPFYDNNGNKLTGYDAKFERDIAYVEISGSLISMYYYDRIIKFDSNGFEFDKASGVLKGKEVKRYEYYNLDNNLKFEYSKPHIFVGGMNAWDLVSKTKNQMKWKYVLDGEEDAYWDLTLTRRKK